MKTIIPMSQVALDDYRPMTIASRRMNSRVLAFVCVPFFLCLAVITAESASGSQVPVPDCGANALFNPSSGECGRVRDRSAQTPAAGPKSAAAVIIEALPSLDLLRDQEALRLGLGGEAGAPVLVRPRSEGAGFRAAPVPGGYGAGTRYLPGVLQVRRQSVLYTKMFVQPNGVDPSAPLEWLMTPATNYTDSATEFVGIYAGHIVGGSFGIFGRPCTPEFPCPDGDTSNGWQAGYGGPMSGFACNLTNIVDQGGHQQTIVHYANETLKLDDDDPPLWRNAIYLWNYCASEWDLIWQHTYREAKRDCSVVSCYSWGPILETWGVQSEINELGYEDTVLLHDGIESLLGSGETTFIQPISPWVLFHLDPNRSYGVGNRVVAAVLEVEIDVSPYVSHNRVVLRSNGNLRVAVFGSADFDALQIEPASARLGPGEAIARNYEVKDYDRDGYQDLGLIFRIREVGLSCRDNRVTLTAQTFDAMSITGTDFITPWPRCR